MPKCSSYITLGKRQPVSDPGLSGTEQQKTTPQQSSEWGSKSLIGAANECVAAVNGRACLALLDTGSQITSISESFYKKHLTDCVIHPVESLLRVVGAAGQDVPFLGYVDVEVEFPEEEAGLCDCVQALVLVVPDNAYNQRLPLVIGANIVKECKTVAKSWEELVFCKGHTPLLHGKELINLCVYESVLRVASRRF